MLSKISVLFMLLCGHTIHGIIVKPITQWTVHNSSGHQYPAKVPGGIYSDLQRAGVIGDILYRFNDVETRWVAYDYWVYEGRFIVTLEQLAHQAANLVFHGVDTVAHIELNDHPVGSTDNMFVRYVFDVKSMLKEGENELKVSFDSPVLAARRRSQQHFAAPECVPAAYHGECHVNQLRKMQASFSWDWGPAFPSVGFWKPAEIEFYHSARIRSVATHISKNDQHWHLKIIAYLETSPHNRKWTGQIRADLVVDGNETISLARDKEVEVDSDGRTQVDLNLTISENYISLWWPNGYGDQPLYDLTVSIFTETATYSKEQHSEKLQIGFRTLELVEDPISTVLGVSPADDTSAASGLTFYFRINGVPLFMKGSNWIPADILPERGADADTVDSLLLSAREAHMSMLRVWGGGVYESDYFYRRCDQLGILIWQDFLFACSMYPVDRAFLDSVRTEIEQNVLRLQHHPSIAIWAGNNENEVALRGNWYNTQTQFDKYKTEYIKLYVDTIKPIVEELDPGRRYLVSSPSNGKESEQEGYIAENPYDPNYGDTHYYNYLLDNWDQNIYPNTRFASEYGLQSFPSLATMRTATKEKGDFQLDSNYSKHRQHSPLGSPNIKHLKLPPENDPTYFEKFVFYSQISQAMAIKAETEFYRQSQATWYTMGALYWQLNDVWQAPSWSGIEYGGKWKMLHYFAKSFFAPVLVSPRLLESGNVDVYLINDRFVPIFKVYETDPTFGSQIIVDVFKWSSLIPVKTEEYPAEVGMLSAKKQNITIPLWHEENKDEIFLRFSLRAPGVKTSPYNFVFPTDLKSIKGLRRPNIQIKVRSSRSNESSNVLQVDISVDTVVLFLWLETDKEGRFEDNGFIVTRPHVTVKFRSRTKVTRQELENSITYQYYL